MIHHHHIPEYRLLILGPAISFRSKKAKGYKLRVRKLAKEIIIDPLKSAKIEIFIDCFHFRKRLFDMDNISKCVLDALNGIAYIDDKQVKLQSSNAHFIGERFDIQGGPIDIIKPLQYHKEHLFIRIRYIADEKRKR